MNRKAVTSKEKTSEVISLTLENLNDCLALDEIALKGLWSKNQWRNELSEPHKLCLGIFECSKIIALGCAHVVIDELHLTAIAVHPKYRRRGFAKKILSSLFLKAIEANCTRATLEVKSDNLKAIDLYSSFGFTTTGCRSNYYKNGADALIQWKSLNLESKERESRP